MALTTIDPNLVRQIALNFAASNPSGTEGDPLLSLVLKAFFRHLSEDRGNPNLYFEAFESINTDQVISDAANTLYFVYAKKPPGGSVRVFMKGTDHASAVDGADTVFQLELNANEDAGYVIYRKGLANGTGLTINSQTESDTDVDTSAAADGPDGFVILGDA